MINFYVAVAVIFIALAMLIFIWHLLDIIAHRVKLQDEFEVRTPKRVK